jgi:hypothetical protein
MTGRVVIIVIYAIKVFLNSLKKKTVVNLKELANGNPSPRVQTVRKYHAYKMQCLRCAPTLASLHFCCTDSIHTPRRLKVILWHYINTEKPQFYLNRI